MAASDIENIGVRPAGSTRWTLVTPPGTADNGGLVLADSGGHSLITGLRPSRNLTYTPLAVTGDAGLGMVIGRPARRRPRQRPRRPGPPHPAAGTC